jgi:hypothetical protein
MKGPIKEKKEEIMIEELYVLSECLSWSMAFLHGGLNSLQF